ncbi:MAG: alanine racemase [Provencibacterium sp.]|jgi:alanine racemase|nr:alanine racemase [Provencibacterium sp.]
MSDFLRRTWAEVSLDALRHNLTAIRSLLRPGCRLMAVVKADAYGHGDRCCAQEMAEAGADWFGVSNLEEALSLRDAGLVQPILILGTTPPEEAGTLAARQITQTVFCMDYAGRLQAEAARQGVTLNVHIKVDSGMARIGFDGFSPEACAAEIACAAGFPNLRAEGIFTHFSSADEDGEENDRYTRAQFQRFTAVLQALEQRGIRFAIRHCCNSAATLRFPDMHLDMVRPGLILYGLYPSGCCREHARLLPAMQLKSVVSMVKEIPAGRAVSYGRCFQSGRPLRLATVPIGYADGYHRALSGCGEMLLHGQRAPVAGRVCMDQLMLDVTGIPDVQAEDTVTIFGVDGSAVLPIEEIAEKAGSISYEIVCLIGKRVPRLYLRNGQQCGVARFIRSAQ